MDMLNFNRSHSWPIVFVTYVLQSTNQVYLSWSQTKLLVPCRLRYVHLKKYRILQVSSAQPINFNCSVCKQCL